MNEQEILSSSSLSLTNKSQETLDWSKFFLADSPIEITIMPDQSLRITHRKVYKISSEIYAQWPKFYSIVLENNIASLEFRNSPNFSSLVNILNLFQANFELRDVQKSENNQHMLKITSNGILILGYLYNIYSAFSPQAAEVLHFCLIRMAEYEIDKKAPDWKQDISMRIVAWSDPDEDEEEGEINFIEMKDSCKIIMPLPTPEDLYFGYNLHSIEEYKELYEKIALRELKEKYRNLTAEEKQSNFRNLTLELINEEVKNIISQCDPTFIKEMSYYQKYEQIERVFDTTDKCDNYLYNKNETIKPCVDQIQNIMEQKLRELFTPSVLERLGAAILSDSSSKYAKTSSSAVGGTLDILKATGQLTAKLPIVGILIGAAKLYSSGVFFSREGGLIPEDDKKEIDIAELSKSFSCKVTICSLERFVEVSPESYRDLALFYAKFIYLSITKNPHPYPTESYLASSLLDKLSNQTYVEKLELSELNVNLKTINGDEITISKYLQGYNQTICYAQIHSELMGINDYQTPVPADVIKSETNVTVDYSVDPLGTTDSVFGEDAV